MSPLLCGGEATVLEIENIVQASRAGGADWNGARVNQTLAVGDRIRTRQRSRAAVALSNLYMLRMDQFTTVEITNTLVSSKPTLDLTSGVTFIFSREKSGELEMRLPSANAALRGTQLYASVEPGGKSFLQVFEGSVELKNPHGSLVLARGEAGEVTPGQAPRRTAVIEAKNILQWALYYPAVIDPGELKAAGTGWGRLSQSVAAYRKGNLLEAVRRLPGEPPAAVDQRVYQAGCLLAVGRLDEAGALLGGVPRAHPGRRAIERMVRAVKMEVAPDWGAADLTTSSEAIAESYYQQSHARIEPARDAAERATQLSPANGFAWTRLAELEFSLGHTRRALAAVARGLSLTPENARGHALRGYLLSADNRIADARLAFEEAIRLDGAFGNGWLGLGLTKIKSGEIEAGRQDLQTAATVEPTSSIFHSYLGKAFSREGLVDRAQKDLEFAALLDPNDPTPHLYSAIAKQQGNQTNAAIADLEKSIRLNDNRRVYRSAFLLDQDRAVRSANLARIYQAAGMDHVAVREATRAVESDYTNASAHLFLANSFDALRDPDRILLRYETPWFNELLLSNLLSPVGGGPLSQFVSQQEYSKLLESDGLGGSLVTEWRSTSEVRTAASLFGTHGNVSFGVDAYYRNDDGDRLNSGFELAELYAQLKWQATPDDIVYLLGKWADQQNGDLFETYDNQPISPGLDFEENQQPGLLLAGWNHRWAPGSHTLVLVGRLAASQRMTDPAAGQLLVNRDPAALRPGFIRVNSKGSDEFTDPSLRGSGMANPDGSLNYSPELLKAIAPYLGSGDVLGLRRAPFDFSTRREFEIYSAEVQQIWQTDTNTLLLGGRWQEGEIQTDARLSIIRPTFAGGFSTPAADQHVESDYRRFALYAYDFWQVFPSLTLIGGIGWDSIEHPDNFRNPPVNDRQRDEEKVSGKLGFTWNLSEWFTLRGAAAQGLGGLSYDESVRLEPAQIAGFNQAYRTVLSESLAGSVEAPEYSILGLSADGKLTSRTWWGISAGLVDETVNRTLGVFTGYDTGPFGNTPAYFPDGTPQHLDYSEQNLTVTLNQLIGEEFSVGALWRLTRSELETRFPGLEPLQPKLRDVATLNEISLFGDWNSPHGWFAHVEANWYDQRLDEDPSRQPVRSGDDFVQFNAWAGYRFHRNLCELTLGVLNIGDSDYRLSPLNPHLEIARDRTFFAACRLSF